METFLDPTRPTTERVDDLLSRMSLTEKVGQLNQRLLGWHSWERRGDSVVTTEALDEEAARWGGIGAIYGMQRADAWSGRDWTNGADPLLGVEAVARVQERVVAASRFGIPALFVDEASHGHQALGGTLFPVPLAGGATWDPEVAGANAAHTAREFRARGLHLALVSGIDILRDPRWGRSEECYGEDPVLAAEIVRAIAIAWGDEAGVGVVLKHFAAQGGGTGGRNSSGAPIGQRELDEIHLPAARAGVAAGAVGIMAAYSDIDGVPCHANRQLLTEVLREQWGFEGIVMADMLAIDRLTRSSRSPAQSGALAVQAGVDMSLSDEAFVHLEQAVSEGLLDESAVDLACARVLRVKFDLGLLDPPTALPAFPPPFAAESPSAGMVLLSNASALPLAPDCCYAVLGPLADDLQSLLGDYVPPLAGNAPPSVLEALQLRLGRTLPHERGTELSTALDGGIERAVTAARGAGGAILMLGTTAEREYGDDFEANGAASLGGPPPKATTGEGFDVAEVRLPQPQLDLAAAVAATGVPTIAVVIAGRPLGVEELDDLCDAVLFAAYPGPAGADAVVDVLTGKREPRGRLNVSLPASSGTLPAAYNGRLETTERYIDAEAAPRHPFGTGLGYTTWMLEPLVCHAASTDLSLASIRASVSLTNTGARAGAQVVQYYARAKIPGLVPRRAVLIGFERVELSPGERRTVELSPAPEAAMALGLEPGLQGELELWASVSGSARPDLPSRLAIAT